MVEGGFFPAPDQPQLRMFKNYYGYAIDLALAHCRIRV